jgi:hemerythrin
MEPIQWSEKFSVGVRELDQQHQQLIKVLNRLISASGTINTHSEMISDILIQMTRYAEGHFKTEERLMEAYGYLGLEEQKKQHLEFRIKTVEFSIATYLGVAQIPEGLVVYLTDWLTHHILEDDMAYRSFSKIKALSEDFSMGNSFQKDVDLIRLTITIRFWRCYHDRKCATGFGTRIYPGNPGSFKIYDFCSEGRG